MGFDLYGTNGGNEKIDHDNPVEGQYFRANVWYWRPLWDLTCIIGKDILTDDDIKGGQFNDGHHISEEKSVELADLFKELIREGLHRTIVAEKDAYLNTLPLEKCTYCSGTGERDDEHVKGECNGCKGRGETESTQTWYRLDVPLIEEFETFMRHSGGFEIC